METITENRKKTEKIAFPIDLIDWQAEVMSDQHQFISICAGRRSGKTRFALPWLIGNTAAIENAFGWYVAPSYTMAKTIAWDETKFLMSDFRDKGLIRKQNDSELLVNYGLNSTIQLKGADNPDSLRGVGPNFIVLDEYAVMKRAVWEEVLRPSVADKRGRGLFISTPKGYNHFYDLYQMELKFPKVWKSYHFTTWDNPYVPREEIEQAKRDMDGRVFKQEFEASFETFGGQVFPSFDRSKHVLASIKFENDLEFDLGMDFGWSNPTVTLFIQVNDNDDVFVFDELRTTQTTIKEIGNKIMAKEYHRERVEYTEISAFSSIRPLKHLSLKKPDCIYCDPAGDAKHEAMGTSSVHELRKQGFNVKYRKKYPGVVQDRTNIIRKWLNNGKLFLHPRCVNLIRAFEMHRYPDPKEDIQSELPLKDGISDHDIDALGEFFINRFPSQGANWETL